MKPTRAQKIQFDQQGFLHVPNMVSAAQVAVLRNAHTNMVEAFAAEMDTPLDDYLRVVSQWTNVWESQLPFDGQLRNPVAAEFAAGLLEAESVQLFHDQIISKVPNHSGAVPWHQDLGFWPLDQPRGVSCWIALDDATAESGAMHYMPGTHKEPIEPATDFLQTKKDWGPRIREAVGTSPRAGDAIFHDARTWHTTPPNKTQGQRRAYIVIFLDGRVRYAPEKAKWAPINRRVTVAPGQPLNADKFPILWAEA